MNFRQLQFFQMAMETGSITEAARRLHVTQPAVSKALAQFEASVGFEIFIRHGRRVLPTPEARALYLEVEKAFVGLSRIREFARDVRDLKRGHLVVGSVPVLASRWLPGVMARFTEAYPNVTVALRVLETPTVAEGVASGAFDLGVAYKVPETPRLKQTTLAAVEAFCVVPAGHRLASRQVVEPRDLDGEDFVSMGRSVHGVALDEILGRENVRPRVRVEATLNASVYSLVEAGVGVAVVARTAPYETEGRSLVFRPFRPAIVAEICAMEAAHRPHSVLINRFLAQVKASLGEEATKALFGPDPGPGG